MIAIIDAGSGNLRSLENALSAVGLPSRRVTGPADLRAGERVVLPGVGHFGHAASRLRETGLGPALRGHVARGGQLLGICLGMQLLYEFSAEAPGQAGLGIWPGSALAFDSDRVKVPHMGWSPVRFQPDGGTGAAYFVHSYYLPPPADPVPDERIGLAEHGAVFLAARRAGPVAGCQFHPEKSGDWGLNWLKEAVSW